MGLPDPPEPWSTPAKSANHQMLRDLSLAPKAVQPLMVEVVKDAETSIDDDGRLFVKVQFNAIQRAVEKAQAIRFRDIFVSVVIVAGSCISVLSLILILR